jgi:hypothetical protein
MHGLAVHCLGGKHAAVRSKWWGGGLAGKEAYTVRITNIISQWQYLVTRCLSSYVDSVFGLPSSDVGEMHSHTIISVDSVTREVEAGSFSVVKHLQVTAMHVVTLVERIRYQPGRRDTFIAVC